MSPYQDMNLKIAVKYITQLEHSRGGRDAKAEPSFLYWLKRAAVSDLLRPEPSGGSLTERSSSHDDRKRPWEETPSGSGAWVAHLGMGAH